MYQNVALERKTALRDLIPNIRDSVGIWLSGAVVA
jgi:hypothetical protein